MPTSHSKTFIPEAAMMSGIQIWAATNGHLTDELEVCLLKGIWHCKLSQLPVAGEAMESREPTIATLLNRCTFKLYPKYISLDPQLNVMLTPHQRSCFRRQTDTITEKHIWSKGRERPNWPWAVSPQLIYLHYNPYSLELREHCRRGRHCKGQRIRTFEQRDSFLWKKGGGQPGRKWGMGDECDLKAWPQNQVTTTTLLLSTSSLESRELVFLFAFVFWNRVSLQLKQSLNSCSFYLYF